MGQTLVEKIIAARSGRERVSPGEAVDVRYDSMLLSGADVDLCEGLSAPKDPSRVVGIPDDLPGMPGRGESYSRLRKFVAGSGATFVPLGRGGIAPHELIDRGYVTPGRFVVSRDDRVGSFGALGCIGWSLDVESARSALSEGKISVTVPSSISARVAGTLARWTRGRDVAFAAYNSLSEAGVQDHAVEIHGPTIERCDPTDRLEIAAMAMAAGARTTAFAADDGTLTWIRARSIADARPLARDAEAAYAGSIDVDVEGLEPMVMQASGSRAVRVTELPDVPVHVVVIGGDAGGRIEDLRVAAQLLREHPVSSAVRLFIVPATARCQLHAITEGLSTVFLRAGAVMLPPMNGAARYADGAVAAGECVLDTGVTTRGAGAADRYIAGAAVAAASAVIGRVAHPDEVLRSKREAV